MVLIYINRAKEKALFFFLKKLTSFQELACFSLVTLSFEIQPREAIPVEIKTDTRGFDSNAALSLAHCLAGAACCRDGTGRSQATMAGGVGQAGGGEGGDRRRWRGSFNLVCFSPEAGS